MDLVLSQQYCTCKIIFFIFLFSPFLLTLFFDPLPQEADMTAYIFKFWIKNSVSTLKPFFMLRFCIHFHSCTEYKIEDQRGRISRAQQLSLSSAHRDGATSLGPITHKSRVLLPYDCDIAVKHFDRHMRISQMCNCIRVHSWETKYTWENMYGHTLPPWTSLIEICFPKILLLVIIDYFNLILDKPRSWSLSNLPQYDLSGGKAYL